MALLAAFQGLKGVGARVLSKARTGNIESQHTSITPILMPLRGRANQGVSSSKAVETAPQQAAIIMQRCDRLHAVSWFGDGKGEEGSGKAAQSGLEGFINKIVVGD